jgi:23S rRNA pseudouridine1911/1915/1917 synthase
MDKHRSCGGRRFFIFLFAQKVRLMSTFELNVPSLYASKRIDAYLAATLAGKFSRQEIKTSLTEEKIFLNGKPARPRDPVKEGDRIIGEVVSQKNETLIPEHIALKIIYEDESILVIDKAAGMVVHPGAGNKKGTLVHALLGRGSKLSDMGGLSRPGIVHRLDKDTSGLLVVAKDNASHKALQSQFASRTLSKTYMALVAGNVDFEEGHISKSIGRDAKIRGKMAVSQHESAREAETRYRVLKRFPYATLVEVKIITGRTHQIRVHFGDLGHPVVGDVLYGTSRVIQPRLALHAAKIEFAHPKTGKMMTFESPLPDELNKMIESAEGTKK